MAMAGNGDEVRQMVMAMEWRRMSLSALEAGDDGDDDDVVALEGADNGDYDEVVVSAGCG